MAELVESIRANGVQQPIVVRARDVEGGTSASRMCHPIMGARRVEASRRAGLLSIPAIVRVGMSDQDALMLAVVENTNRENLNAIDEASGWKALLSAGWTQQEIVQHVGCSQSNIANGLRLLRLPEEVQDLVRAGSLSATSARALLQYEGDPQLIRELAGVVMAERIASRVLEGSGWPDPLMAVLARHGVHRREKEEPGLIAHPSVSEPDYSGLTNAQLTAEQTRIANMRYTLRKGRPDAYTQAQDDNYETLLQRIGAEWVRRGELPGMVKGSGNDKSPAEETGKAGAESGSIGRAERAPLGLADKPGSVGGTDRVPDGGGNSRSEQAVDGISASPVIGEEEGVVDVEDRTDDLRSAPESTAKNTGVGAAKTVGDGVGDGGANTKEQTSLVGRLAPVPASGSQSTSPTATSAASGKANTETSDVTAGRSFVGRGTETSHDVGNGRAAQVVTPPVMGSMVMAMIPRDEYEWMISEGLTAGTALALLRASGEASAEELKVEDPNALDVNFVALVSENEGFREANRILNEKVDTLQEQLQQAQRAELSAGYHADLNAFVLCPNAQAALTLITERANRKGPARTEYDQLEIIIVGRARLIEDKEFE